MEYPGATFTRVWRRLLLIVFLAAFCIMAPTIVLYTTGYRYDWKYGLLRQTGSVSVDVEPRNAIVSIDGLELPDKIPVRLKNITPHSYVLKISAPGFYDWIKEINVQNRETTYIKDIALLRKSHPSFLTKAHVEKLVMPGNGHSVLFTDVQKDNVVIRRLNTESGLSETILLSPASTTLSCAKTSSWCELSEYKGQHPRVLLFDADSPVLKYPDNFIDIRSILKSPIVKFMWDTGNNPIAYFSTTSSIYALPISTQQLQNIGDASTILDWYANNGTLWTLESSTSTAQWAVFKHLAGSVTREAVVPSQGYDPLTVQLLYANAHTILMGSGATMRWVNADRVVDFDTTKLLASYTSDALYLYSQNEIWRTTDGTQPTLAYRTNEPLGSVILLDQFNTLGMLTSKKLTAYYSYYLVAQDLVNKKITTAVADINSKNIIYADKDGLWQIAY